MEEKLYQEAMRRVTEELNRIVGPIVAEELMKLDKKERRRLGFKERLIKKELRKG